VYPDLRSQIIIICGPTGVGKTSFAIRLAREFGGHIVGADSMQIYRHMDIGTAKPTTEEKSAVPHHMVDIVDPDQSFDAAAYGERAGLIIQTLLSNKTVPFVVGGTGLYIKALQYGLFESRTSDMKVRTLLKAQLAEQGTAAMHARLTIQDPQSAARIHVNDVYRILRALEVIALTGQPISAHQQAHGFRQARYSALCIGLDMPRPQLYARIELRVDAMIAEGLLKEVRGLLARGYDPGLKSMQSLGYRHMIDFIQGRTDWEQTIAALKRDHRRYAKRQLTWFRADPTIQWLAPDQVADAKDMVKAFILPSD